jgi:hypothetical protein
MALPFHLTTLPKEALDVLRYMATLDMGTSAFEDEIREGAGLSERGASRAIKRLVTKEYVVMDQASRAYSLTDLGYTSIDEIAAHDQEQGTAGGGRTARAGIARAVFVVAPRVLASNRDHEVLIGFDAATNNLAQAADLVLQIDVLHGSSDKTRASLSVSNEATHVRFNVKPSAHKMLRLRLKVFQMDANGDGINQVGGMYADFEIGSAASADRIAYATIVQLENYG